MLQEPIRFGQRISEFSVDMWLNNEWNEICAGTTIGYKRLLRINPIKTDRIRILIKDSRGTLALSNTGLFKASNDEP